MLICARWWWWIMKIVVKKTSFFIYQISRATVANNWPCQPRMKSLKQFSSWNDLIIIFVNFALCLRCEHTWESNWTGTASKHPVSRIKTGFLPSASWGMKEQKRDQAHHACMALLTEEGRTCFDTFWPADDYKIDATALWHRKLLSIEIFEFSSWHIIKHEIAANLRIYANSTYLFIVLWRALDNYVL